VLLLDDILEFRRSVLAKLSQVYRNKVVELHRQRVVTVLPADFTLVGATPVCPCGHNGGGLPSKWEHRCECTREQMLAYRERLRAFGAMAVVPLGTHHVRHRRQ
jgi:magnesium chelatase family protein